MALSIREREIRRMAIGASEIGALAGLSSYQSPFSIWQSKVEPPAPEQKNVEQVRGTYLERAVLDWFRAEGAPGVQIIERSGFIVSRSNPIVGATPDTLARFPESLIFPVEAKTSWTMEGWGPDGSAIAPPGYLAQVTWQIAALKDSDEFDPEEIAGYGMLPAFFTHHDEFRSYRVPFDGEFFGLLLEVARRFWVDHVLTKTPPPIDYRDPNAEGWINRRFPKNNGTTRPATVEEEDLCARLYELDAVRVEVEPQSKALTRQLREMIGEADGILLADGKRVTWKKKRDTEAIDHAAVVEELARLYPEQVAGLITKHTRIKTGSRVFLKSWTRSLKSTKGGTDGDDE